MKRKIIEINEELCNGCGNCITGCAEGALQLVNGKAKLVKEQFCDGFGDCIGTCPTGALQIIERESEEFNIEATREHVRNIGGAAAVKKMDEANAEHDAKEAKQNPPAGGCPGLRMRFNEKKEELKPAASPAAGAQGQVIRSDLDQWPIMLHLVQPQAPFFNGKELVVLSTCSSVSSPDVHWRFVRGRALVVACPKLDRTEGYVEKLTAILKENDIPKVIVVRMEVPCCGGLTAMTRAAVEGCGRTDLVFEEATIGLDGEIQKIEEL